MNEAVNIMAIKCATVKSQTLEPFAVALDGAVRSANDDWDELLSAK